MEALSKGASSPYIYSIPCATGGFRQPWFPCSVAHHFLSHSSPASMVASRCRSSK